MFFITNHESCIIAADTDFLDKIGVDNIYSAALLIQNGNIKIDELEKSLIHLDKSDSFVKTRLNTLFGDIYLYKLDIQDTEQKDESFLGDDLLNLAVDQAGLTGDAIDKIEDASSEADDNIFELLDEGDEAIDSSSEPEKELSTSDEKVDNFPEIETFEDVELEDKLPIEQVVEQADEDLSLETDTLETDKENDILSAPEVIGIAGAGATLGALINNDSKNEYEDQLVELKESDDIDISISSTEDGVEFNEFDNLELQSDKETEIVENEFDNIELLSDRETEAVEVESQVEFPFDSIDDLSKESAETTSEQVSDITESYQPSSSIDTKEIADLIGIPEDEYAKFLEEFQSEASKLESDLRSNDFMKSREATVNLKEASLLLHLPHIAEKLSELSNATSDEKESVINDFMALVASTDTNNNAKEMIAPTNETTIEDEASLFKDQEANKSDKESADIPSSTQLVDTNINLDDIQAMPFDFSINEAADDLTLPASLVSEFVIDFIGQAKDNLPVLQQAYENKDLDTLQSTAHMLKGASSNLRITPMADTLYNLQFNDDLTKVPELIKRFSGQLKALSIQMEQN